MCHSVQASLIAFVISITISGVLYKRNRGFDRLNSGFIISFALIQLWEGINWYMRNNDQLTPGFDNNLTILIMLTLVAQPLVQNYLGYKYTHSDILHVTTWFYIAVFVYALIVAFRENTKYHTFLGNSRGLVWQNEKGEGLVEGLGLAYVYLIGLFIPLLITRQYALIAVGVLTIMYCAFISEDQREFSSMWCYSAVIYSIVSLMS